MFLHTCRCHNSKYMEPLVVLQDLIKNPNRRFHTDKTNGIEGALSTRKTSLYFCMNLGEEWNHFRSSNAELAWKWCRHPVHAETNKVIGDRK